MNYLDKINEPSDIKKLSRDELKLLAKELRSFIIDSVSRTGGHLSSNLGVIELTIALHYVYDCPNDQIVWDVGHQTYAHKILTGRRENSGAMTRRWQLQQRTRSCGTRAHSPHSPRRNRRATPKRLELRVNNDPILYLNLKLHHVAARGRTHEARAHCTIILVEGAHVPRVFVMIHHVVVVPRYTDRRGPRQRSCHATSQRCSDDHCPRTEILK